MDENNLIEQMFELHNSLRRGYYDKAQLKTLFFEPMQMILDDYIDKRIEETLNHGGV